MKYRTYQRYREKKQQISGKKMIEIDPAKEKHQAAVVGENGIQMGKPFSFQVKSQRSQYRPLLSSIKSLLARIHCSR